MTHPKPAIERGALPLDQITPQDHASFLDPPKAPFVASARGRASRARGIRFERRIARELRAAGLSSRRVLEYDGFSHGVDVVACWPGAESAPWPVAIQCKASKNPRDLASGWDELAANSTARHRLCVHLLFIPGQRPELRCVYNGASVSWTASLLVLICALVP